MPESAPADAADPIQARFGRWIDEAAEANRLDSALIRAVIAAESGGNPRAVSPAGAKGLMQLMDTTAADMGVKEPFDARENIMSGTKYLRRLIDRFGDLKLALAAYNAGPGTVERHGGVPPYAETRAYVEKVLDSARALAADGGAPDGESKAPGGARR
ncbi:MAG: lytic transglycosylase domain-containing protein [candidate division Zixibacteria bacterium]|nr:lytic transglycosylase domain-containing protein [candidate division Zixibacteria bacterium]